MSRAHFSLALAGLSLLATGCDEKLESCPGQCTVVNGRLVTSGQQPLAGVSVTAIYKAGNFGSSTKARTSTDANGNFQLSFYTKDDELSYGYTYLSYQVDKSRYYMFVDNTDQLPSLRRDTTYQLSPFLFPRKAAVKVTVPNPDRIQGSFQVLLTSAYGHSLATTHGLGTGPTLYVPRQTGSYTSTVDVAGDQKLYVLAQRVTNGVATRTLDSLVVPAGTTRDLTVRY